VDEKGTIVAEIHASRAGETDYDWYRYFGIATADGITRVVHQPWKYI